MQLIASQIACKICVIRGRIPIDKNFFCISYVMYPQFVILVIL